MCGSFLGNIAPQVGSALGGGTSPLAGAGTGGGGFGGFGGGGFGAVPPMDLRMPVINSGNQVGGALGSLGPALGAALSPGLGGMPPPMQNPFLGGGMGAGPYQPGMQIPISSVNSTTQQDIMGRGPSLESRMPAGLTPEIRAALGIPDNVQANPTVIPGSLGQPGMPVPNVPPQVSRMPVGGGMPQGTTPAPQVPPPPQMQKEGEAFRQQQQQAFQKMQADPRFQQLQRQMDKYQQLQ